MLLNNGADKVSINSHAVNQPSFIDNLASKYGSQCVVVAVDAKQIEDDWDGAFSRRYNSYKVRII